jgi:hypothetical protein
VRRGISDVEAFQRKIIADGAPVGIGHVGKRQLRRGASVCVGPATGGIEHLFPLGILAFLVVVVRIKGASIGRVPTVVALAMVKGVKSMLEDGVAPKAAPTLMISISLHTVLGILMLWQDHGLHIYFGVESGARDTLALLSKLPSERCLFKFSACLFRAGLIMATILARENDIRRILCFGLPWRRAVGHAGFPH